MMQFINVINEMMECHQLSRRGRNTNLEFLEFSDTKWEVDFFNDVANFIRENDS